MAEKQSKRESKKQERDERVHALHQAYPDLAAADEALSSHALSVIRKSLHGSTEKLDEANQTYQQLLAIRDAVLAKYGLSTAIYEPQWDCPKCEDRGYVRPGVICECQQRQRREATFIASGIPEKYRRMSFDNFRVDVYTNPSDMQNKVERLKKFVTNLAAGQPMGNLMLRGYVGRGKTHLSVAIANAAIAGGLTVVYRRVDDLLDLIRICKFEKGQLDEDTARLYNMIYNADLLILDDFGAEPKTEFAINELTRILEERNLNNRSWIINTNLEINEIEKAYDPRIMDRIAEKTTVFRLEAADSFRRKEAKRNSDVQMI